MKRIAWELQHKYRLESCKTEKSREWSLNLVSRDIAANMIFLNPQRSFYSVDIQRNYINCSIL